MYWQWKATVEAIAVLVEKAGTNRIGELLKTRYQRRS